MTTIKKLNTLLDQVEEKVKNLRHQNQSAHDLRQENLQKIQKLYNTLEIFNKHADFSTIFDYKAMNLSGFGLKNEDFSEIREGKYVQIIAIAYDVNEKGKRMAKNSSLGYFGKAEKVTPQLKNDIIEFVLRWRYEKAFGHTEYYQHLLSKLH